MFKTIEATLDAQGKIHWQEERPPPIQGYCRVLITLLDDLADESVDLAPHQPERIKNGSTPTLIQRWQKLRENIPDEWEEVDFSEIRDRSIGRNVE